MAWNQNTQQSAETPKGGGKIVPIACAIVVVACAAVVVALCFERSPEEAPEEVADAPAEVRTPVSSATNRPDVARSRKDGMAKKSARRLPRRPAVDPYTPEERKVADAVQAALDDDNFDQTRAAAAVALKNANPELRREAVQALGWFGEKALVDLTKAMSDKDPAVAEAARDQVEQALNGMESSHQAFVLAFSYIEAFGKDKESVKMLLGLMESKGCDIVEPDDGDSPESVQAARVRRQDVVVALSRLIEADALSEDARAAYSTITGEEWTDLAAAEQWAESVPDPAVEEVPADEAAEAADGGSDI